MPASDLKWYGHAGGNGLDGVPLQAASDLFKKNMVRACRDIYGKNAVIRCDQNMAYNPSSDTYSINFGPVDAIVNYARTYECLVLIDIHSLNYSHNSGTTDAIPRISAATGKLEGWMDGVTAVCNHFSSDIADGVVKFIEIWNEPNSIGDVAGHLNGPGANPGNGILLPGAAGSFTMNGRSVPYYEIIGRIVKDAGTAIQNWRNTHGNPALQVSGPCTGAIDNAYMRAILDWAYEKAIPGGALVGRQEMTTAEKNADRGLFVEDPVGGPVGRRLLNACSVHVYQHDDPLVEPGSTTRIRSIATIGTDFRPLISKYTGGGYPGTGIYITEGISAGSDKWNRYQKFGGIEGIDKASLENAIAVSRYGLAPDPARHKGKINWDNVDGAGRPANQFPTDLSLPIVQRNFYRKARSLNGSGAGIELILPHVLIREQDITQDDATKGSPPGNQAWQFGRAYMQIAVGSAYIAASGSPFRGPQWFPVAGVIHDEIASYSVSTPPVFSSAVTINDLTPVVGQVLTATPGNVSGNPTPTTAFQWQRDPGTGFVNVTGATNTTYTVVSGDLGARLRVIETADNPSGTATSTSAPTSAVTNPTVLVPVNQTPPKLSDTDGALTVSNHPNPGKQITADPGTWSPDPTSYSYSWERMAPDGTITTI